MQTQTQNPVQKLVKYYTDLTKLYYNCEDNSSEDENRIRLKCGNFAINISVTDNVIVTGGMLSVNINTSTSKYTIKMYRDSIFAEYTDVDGNVEHYSCHGDHHCIRNALRWVKKAFSLILDGMGRYPSLPQAQDIDIELSFSSTRNGKGFIHVFVLLNGYRFHALSIDPWGNIVFYPQLSHFHKYTFRLNTAKVLL